MTTNPVLQFRVTRPLTEAEVALRQALQEQGFGILTEVDVAAVMRQKLGIEMRPHRLLGACNPQIAHASLEAEPNVGAFLPCGISLREGVSPDETIVTIQNPEMIGEAFGVSALTAPSDEALKRLRAALTKIGTPT